MNAPFREDARGDIFGGSAFLAKRRSPSFSVFGGNKVDCRGRERKKNKKAEKEKPKRA
jgi:hypothetical protein